jgi:putative ABC transport system substrate-binding protein
MEPDSVRQADELRELEAQYGFQTVKMPIRRADEVKKLVFAGKADVVLVSVSAVANEGIDTIVQLAHDAKVPVISQTGGTGERGVVLNISPSAAEQGAAAGRIAARLLRGESPASIAAEVPKLVELVLNLKEAGALGIKVPIDVITDATKVIK